jgi:hypothetical protein
MKYFLFILVIFFSSIVFEQSKFNPPKSTINKPLKIENVKLNTIFFTNNNVRIFNTIDNIFYDILDTLNKNNILNKIIK